MATSNESPSVPGRFAWTWDDLLAGRPLLALAVVWLTTAGHAMNFREMGIAHGWVSAELYSLQTVFAVSIALTLLACPALGQHLSCRRLTQLGLVLLTGASFLNGLYIHAPFGIFLAGRALAGARCGPGDLLRPAAARQPLGEPHDLGLHPVAGHRSRGDRGRQHGLRLVGLGSGDSCSRGPPRLDQPDCAALHGGSA